MIRRNSCGITMFGLIILCLCTSASSTELCTAAYLRGCDNPVDNKLCLQKLHACGAYDTIITAYDKLQIAPKPLGNYYMGVSYYGLFVRSRAESYRCTYADAAQSQFLTFLDKLVSEGNLYNPENFDRVRHGTKLLERLNQLDNCLQSGFTEDEVRRYVSVYARTLLRGLFLPGEAKGAVADNVDNVSITIRNTIGAYLNKAVGLEVGISLRRQAMEVVNDLVNDILVAYEGEVDGRPTFGKPSVKRDDDGFIVSIDKLTVAPVGSNLNSVGVKVPGWFEKAQNVEAELKKALGEISIEQYEAARVFHAGSAKDAINQSISSITISRDLLPTSEEDSSLTSTIKAIDAAKAETFLEKHYQAILQRRLDGVAVEEICGKDVKIKQWYCVQ